MAGMTESMARLRDEIVALRRARLAFRCELAREGEERRAHVAALCAAWARDRAGARRVWSDSAAARPGASASRREQQLHRRPSFQGAGNH